MPTRQGHWDLVRFDITNKIMYSVSYPGDKDFIFSVFDDTDVATLDYIRPIYDYLTSLNIYTTKSVWPLGHSKITAFSGSHTLEDPPYARYIQELSERGFEIGFHGASMGTSNREKVRKSFDKFYEILGFYPRSCSLHAMNRDNLYWGASRFSFMFLRILYYLLSREGYRYYLGHVEGSPYFWGDMSKKYIKYMRNFTFHEINLFKISNYIPYRVNSMPWVNKWFFTSDADNVEEFNRLLNEENQDRLKMERGICIISTHFGKGYLQEGKVHPRTRYLLKRISESNGWFAPVSEIMDYLSLQIPSCVIQKRGLFKLELKWFLHSLTRRGKIRRYKKTEVPYLQRALPYH